MQSDDIINLVSSSDEHPSPKRPRTTPPPPSPASSNSDIEFISQSKLTEKPAQDLSAAVAATGSGGGGGDEDLAVVGQHNALRALVDYPHFRFQCAIKTFKRQRQPQKEKYCERCFCYVCDIPAGECKNWKVHCKAVDSMQRWRSERETVLEERRRREEMRPSERRTIQARHCRPMVVGNREDEQSVCSSVEEIVMGEEVEMGSEQDVDDVIRGVEDVGLEEDVFRMQPLAFALEGPVGVEMRAQERRERGR